MTGGRRRGGTRRRGWLRRSDHHKGEQSVPASEPAGPGGAGTAEPAGSDAQASLDQVLRRAADARRPEPGPPD